MKRILAAVDFSDSTQDVLDMTKKMAKAFDSEVMIIHTEPPHPVLLYYYGVGGPLYTGTPDEEMKKDEAALNIVQHMLSDEGIKTECKLLEGPTLETIVEEAENFKAELIIAGSHKHGALYNLFVGSISEKLVRQTPCPIMVIPHEVKK